jgi:hypothetical protein
MKPALHTSLSFAAVAAAISICVLPGFATSPAHTPCKVRSAIFQGWNALEMSNDWVRLDIVPQLGGRLMQVRFGDHTYLFVNSKYKGQYFPPSAAENRHWFNYGGDKLWPLPEGHGEGQWPGPASDLIDDGEFKSTIVSQGEECRVHLEGPGDPETGLQYLRDISIRHGSPQISFHSVMKNVANHPIRWSMQSVTQYDTSANNDPQNYNRSFWAFAPIKPRTAYPNGYFVRAGLADDPSYSVEHGLFRLRWLYLQNEVWLDSDAGWIGVVDDTSKYGMFEHFHYVANADYPGKASIIFYKNGAALTLDEHDMPLLRSTNPREAPYYMEAELNTPMIGLLPGASYAFDTEWFPARADKELTTVTPAGVIEHALAGTATSEGIHVSAGFGVFHPGKLVAHVLDGRGAEISRIELLEVDPLTTVEVNQMIQIPESGASIAIHLRDADGMDRGVLGEAKIMKREFPP